MITNYLYNEYFIHFNKKNELQNKNKNNNTNTNNNNGKDANRKNNKKRKCKSLKNIRINKGNELLLEKKLLNSYLEIDNKGNTDANLLLYNRNNKKKDKLSRLNKPLQGISRLNQFKKDYDILSAKCDRNYDIEKYKLLNNENECIV